MNFITSKAITDPRIDLKALESDISMNSSQKDYSKTNESLSTTIDATVSNGQEDSKSIIKENPKEIQAASKDDDKRTVLQITRRNNRKNLFYGQGRGRPRYRRIGLFNRRGRYFRQGYRPGYIRTRRFTFSRQWRIMRRTLPFTKRLTRQRNFDLQVVQDGRLALQSKGVDVKLYNQITTKLFSHYTEKIEKPKTQFQEFVEEKRLNAPRKSIKELREEWDKLPDKEAREEKTWLAFKKFREEYKKYEIKRLEIMNELRALAGKPRLMGPLEFKKGFEIYWEEIESEVKPSMPNASEFKLDVKRREMWKALPKEQKSYYLAKSWLEKEYERHRVALARLNDQINIAKQFLPQKGIKVDTA